MGLPSGGGRATEGTEMDRTYRTLAGLRAALARLLQGGPHGPTPTGPLAA